jgi:hypothetical protein
MTVVFVPPKGAPAPYVLLPAGLANETLLNPVPPAAVTAELLSCVWSVKNPSGLNAGYAAAAPNTLGFSAVPPTLNRCVGKLVYTCP